MPKSSQTRKKSSPRGAWTKRDAASGRITGTIDEADAVQFRKASKSYAKEVTSSKAKAVKALKASGYLTEAGTISKRYR